MKTSNYRNSIIGVIVGAIIGVWASSLSAQTITVHALPSEPILSSWMKVFTPI